MDRMALTFYCDDTGPYGHPPEAFKTFLDFVASEGVAGESSVILGARSDTYGLLSRPTTEAQKAYIEQLQRAYACGIDAHMEIMTHGRLYDFDGDRLPDKAAHEGVWLCDPEVEADAYASYFARILEEGERIGVKFTGLTLPGCGCEACKKRYAEIGDRGFFHKVNPSAWEGLLRVAMQGKFRNRTAACFICYDAAQRGPVLTAGDGAYGIYDLAPNALDRFGRWTNDPAHVDADYYITADGEGGRIPELLREGAPCCTFYAHWQGLNPHNGVGWEAFMRVVRRVQRFLGDRVVWMRPSDVVERFHTGRGRLFY